jgi:hypothetical protein
LISEQILIRRHFPFLEPRIKGRELICRGLIQPTEYSEAYRIEIKYTAWHSPSVRIVEPEIKPNLDAHMFPSGKLCLYDSREQPWQKNWHLHETVIPWTAEWLVFYELFLLTGKWLGKSAPHGSAKLED